MKKKIRFCVIGGQYKYIYYGGTPTLLGAKRLATRNIEHWDNYAGWHWPNIYRIEDTVEHDDKRYPKLEDGERAYPISYYDSLFGRWVDHSITSLQIED